MSATLTLATQEHSEKVLPLVAAFHAEEGLSKSDEAREAAVLPLLEGTPHGALYLIGPLRAPAQHPHGAGRVGDQFGRVALAALATRPHWRLRNCLTVRLMRSPGR